MSIVKIQNKKALEQLQARLTLRLGRKLTQQETLDFCVMLANQNFEKLLEIVTQTPILTREKVKRIIDERNTLKNEFYDNKAKFENLDDEDIYNR